ncbi:MULTISPECIES: PadR family transcriptional regulator [Gordonibacter]|uniref:PadR family transcriptional regulator n=1 Tax=Gordonibacter faecis TaxID=3047475 RepID=A0ABT7DLJ7_9ACTN|nr:MULTISPECIES: PadR family transcriptional regulator [unclassified Gordonibacter]MDJ1650393.1 PadR family transcriptional regulator [Gordonibacter sp. KGMB12511]HIW76762.1 PadR family transcriptional regulator [Candidatus Gordonibacter avicola]
MPRGDCEGSGARQPCCRRRGGGGGALVEPAALAALLYAGGYGYDMRRTILEMTDGEVDVDVGGLYRSLRRLEEEGAVVSRWCEDASGPRRREYELTEQGMELAEQWLDALRARQRLDELLVGLLEGGLAQVGRTSEEDAGSHAS